MSRFFLWGDKVPPRPPKCALKGAFHEVVRLGPSSLAWCVVSLDEFFCFSLLFFRRELQALQRDIVHLQTGAPTASTRHHTSSDGNSNRFNATSDVLGRPLQALQRDIVHLQTGTPSASTRRRTSSDGHSKRFNATSYIFRLELQALQRDVGRSRTGTSSPKNESPTKGLHRCESSRRAILMRSAKIHAAMPHGFSHFSGGVGGLVPPQKN